jgi:hypothetical protein
MQHPSEEQLRRLVEQERQFVKDLPLPPAREPSTIPFTELAPAPPDSPIATEWNFYRREVGRLLDEGHKGKWVLIQGEQLIGIWDTFEEADEVQRSLTPPVMIKQVLKREPVIRIG